MKKMCVALMGLAVMSCGGAPAETGWYMRTAGIMCDRMHECLNTPEMKNIQFAFYLGANAGDCRAAINESDADRITRDVYGERKFVQAEADKCTDAVQKLPC